MSSTDADFPKEPAAATSSSKSAAALAFAAQPAAGSSTTSAKQALHNAANSNTKRGRSHSLHGGTGVSSASSSPTAHHHGGGNSGGWIRVGRNGKSLFHQQHAGAASSSGSPGASPAAPAVAAAPASAGTGGGRASASPRDPVTAIAATAAGKWRRHGHRYVKQPAHPLEPRSRSSSGGGPAPAHHRRGSGGGGAPEDAVVSMLGGGGSVKLSASARRRLKRRQRRIEAASAVLSAAPADEDEDDEDDDDALEESSDDFVVDQGTVGASQHASPPSAADTDTRPTTALPTPSTLPRGGSIAPHPLAAAPMVTLRPLVRCTDGRTTTVRTLTDIMRSSAPAYDLEADTPIVRPADRPAPAAASVAIAVKSSSMHSGSSTSSNDRSSLDGGHSIAGSGAAAGAMPELSLGDAMDAAIAGAAAAARSGDDEDDGMEDRHPSAGDISEGYAGMHHHHHHNGGGNAHDRRSPGGARYLTVPPSAFTIDSIATPNTYAALPHGPAPPPLPASRQTYQHILNAYDPDDGTFAWHDDEAACATFAEQLEILCLEVTDVLRSRSLLRQLDAPAYVLGDIHGNFADLSFFLKSFLVMNDIHLTPCQVLCLGDYVDRGPHSVECVALLFALCLEAPDRVVLLRGNHEDRVVCGDHRTYGDDCFWAQCCRRFGAEPGTRVFRAVTRVFKELPLACELRLPVPGSPKILCTHGGFPRFNINDPETFRRIDLLRRDDFPRFLTLFPNNPLAQDDSGPDEELPDYVEAAWFTAFDLMWSDPTTGETALEQSKLDDNGFCCNMRGLNVMSFSQRAVEEFLRATGYAMLFRAHQEKQFGMRISKSSKVLTLFSSSNYQGHGNGAGCAVVDAKGHIQLVIKNGTE